MVARITMEREKINLCTASGCLRRIFWLFISILILSASARAEGNERPVRIGLPLSIFHKQFALVADWQQYLQIKLNRPVEFINGGKFTDSIVQLHMEKLDFAWVTDYPNDLIGFQARLLAVPLYKGRPYISSYLIVPASDTQTTSFLQLKGTVLALADPTSNSHIERSYGLLVAGEDPRQFFHKVFFTHSHLESIDSVILGLANAAEVDNYIWDGLAKVHPELTAQTRIVTQSQEFGAPPLVANHFVSKKEFALMQGVLIGMAQDPEGLKLLKRMNFDGFIPADAKLYERLVQIKKLLVEER